MTTKPRPTDPNVLARAKSGDLAAHASIYEAFAPMVYTLARRMLASRSHAEDVVQETFVEVIRKLDTFQGDAELGAWIRRIAVNKCLMQLRSAWVSRRTELGDEAPAPSRSYDACEDRVALERALAALSDTARAVVMLHDVEGYTHEEIGRLMGRTASFSKSQLARAHERLRALLEGEVKGKSEIPLCDSVLKIC